MGDISVYNSTEGGPKLRKWYGAPDPFSKDESTFEDDDQSGSSINSNSWVFISILLLNFERLLIHELSIRNTEVEEARNAVLVTDGDSEIGQMVILSLIVKGTRVKALVKDKQTALEAFGTYVESMVGDASDKKFLKKALRGVRTIICPNEGFLSNVEGLKGVQHVVLLSQLYAYRGSGGIQALMKSNARKLAEQDESLLMASGIPYTIIRAGLLQSTPGGQQGFSFEEVLLFSFYHE
ncbi:uncharacterized protein LOC126727730 [Quercus robur]|uniref:uncharacterized protein LOC126727730 n=1 Tax=Quercus robur TaxID=38942 RepID=UPI002163572F|nr:uncharacterized protein LOC126727730 [Quercus robur]